MGAVLLFWREPMFAKMILPLLGGAPEVCEPMGGRPALEPFIKIAQIKTLDRWFFEYRERVQMVSPQNPEMIGRRGLMKQIFSLHCGCMQYAFSKLQFCGVNPFN